MFRAQVSSTMIHYGIIARITKIFMRVFVVASVLVYTTEKKISLARIDEAELAVGILRAK